MTSMAKIFELLDEEPDIRDLPEACEDEICGNIEFDNVSFGYNDYEYVLKNISLRIENGEMIGVVGRSGVGKSTMINLIMRLYDVNRGVLRIDGRTSAAIRSMRCANASASCCRRPTCSKGRFTPTSPTRARAAALRTCCARRGWPTRISS